MSNLCSIHKDNRKDCILCNTVPEEVFPDWNKKKREAIEAGLHTCICGFGYYLTTDICPKCGRNK